MFLWSSWHYKTGCIFLVLYYMCSTLNFPHASCPESSNLLQGLYSVSAPIISVQELNLLYFQTFRTCSFLSSCELFMLTWVHSFLWAEWECINFKHASPYLDWLLCATSQVLRVKGKKLKTCCTEFITKVIVNLDSKIYLSTECPHSITGLLVGTGM